MLPDTLLNNKQSTKHLSHYKTIYIAYSGGADSTALLHLLSQTELKQKLVALHVNHGLQPDAEAWELHCQLFCQNLGIPFHACKVSINLQRGSIEQQARACRYQWFTDFVTAEDVLCTAHHKDDLIETVLFRILRGDSLAQLNPIQTQSNLYGMSLYRPLLEVDKNELLDYCHQHHLQFVHDSSNDSNDFDRNLIRNEVLPHLKARWPLVEHSLSQLSAEVGQLNQALSGMYDDFLSAQPDLFCLKIADLLDYPDYIRRDFIYRWFHQAGLSISQAQYLDIQKQIVQSKSFSMCIKEKVLSSFQSHLYLSNNSSSVSKQITLSQDQLYHGIDWQGGHIQADIDANHIMIKPRQEGEVISIAGRGTRPLKKLLQEWQLEPWLRQELPMIYADDKLIAIADYAIDSASVNTISWTTSSFRQRKPRQYLKLS